MHNLISKAMVTHSLERDELIYLLKESSFDADLFQAADLVRQKFVGKAIHLRALIEFSNICQNNCCYCGLRRDNKNITRYRLDEGTIFQLAENSDLKLSFCNRVKIYGLTKSDFALLSDA